jgi:hypothetical protein
MQAGSGMSLVMVGRFRPQTSNIYVEFVQYAVLSNTYGSTIAEKAKLMELSMIVTRPLNPRKIDPNGMALRIIITYFYFS